MEGPPSQLALSFNVLRAGDAGTSTKFVVVLANEAEQVADGADRAGHRRGSAARRILGHGRSAKLLRGRYHASVQQVITV